jgi:hypothetical protein
VLNCTVDWWILGEYGDGEWVSNGVEDNLIKAHWIHAWSTNMKTHWTINIHLKNEGQDGKVGLFQEMVKVGGG